MTDRKTGGLVETLSAMMDDETTELEFHRVNKALSEDPELRQTWRRYHLGRSVMRGEVAATMSDLSGRISEAVAREASHNIAGVVPGRDQSRTGASFAKPAGPLRKFAVAASVAVVAVFGAIQYQSGAFNGGSDGLPGSASLADATHIESATATAAAPQLLSGYTLPRANLRTASTAPVQRISQSHKSAYIGYDASDLETDRQISNYLQRLMREHAEREALRAQGR